MYLCIDIGIDLQKLYLDLLQVAFEQLVVCLKMTIEWTQRWTGMLWSKRVRRCSYSSRYSEVEHEDEGQDVVYSEMYLKTEIEQFWRYTWRPRSSEPSDTLGGNNCAYLEMYFEAEIEQVPRCTWMPLLGELRDVHWDCDLVLSLEMHLETKIEWMQVGMQTPASRNWRDVSRGGNQANVLIHVDAMIELSWRSTLRRSIWRRSIGMCNVCGDYIHTLLIFQTWEHGKISLPPISHAELACWQQWICKMAC